MDDLIGEIATKLSSVEGMVAVALGGSYARGKQRPDSDIDLGLYYRESQPFSIEEIGKVAAEINDSPDPVVTNFWRWGQWVNGGAWLTVKGQRVDFLYRSIEKVERVIEECRRGRFESDYYQQAPYGFHSYMYLGEIEICKTLYDPDGVLARFKEQLLPYASALKKEIINRFLWGAEFDLAQAEKFAAQNDVYDTAGCFTRCAAALVQVLCALNDSYFLTDKGALKEIESFAARPERFSDRLSEVLARPGQTADELAESASKLMAVVKEVVEVCGELYSRPDFRA